MGNAKMAVTVMGKLGKTLMAENQSVSAKLQEINRLAFGDFRTQIKISLLQALIVCIAYCIRRGYVSFTISSLICSVI